MKWTEFLFTREYQKGLEKARIAYSLDKLVPVLVILLFCLIAIRLVINHELELRDFLLLGATLGILLIYLFTNRKKNRLAGLLITLTVWIPLTIIAWTGSGIKDNALLGYSVCILFSYHIALYWQTYVLFLMSILSIWGLKLAETYRIFDMNTESSFIYSVVYSIVLVFVMMILFLNRKNQLFYYKSLEKEINEKISAEKSLKESESLIRSISNNLTSGMIYQLVRKPGGTTRFTYLSNSVKQLYGISPEEGLADPSLIYSRVHKDDLEVLLAAENEATISKTATRIQVRINEPSGGMRWSLLVSTPTILEDGLVCFDGIEFIISDQKKQEEILRENEKKTRALFDLSFGFIGLLDKDGTVLDVNKTSLDFIGGQLSDVRGKPFWETPWWSHSDKSRKQIIDAIKIVSKGGSVHDEAIHISKDGSERIIDFRLKPIFDDSGNVEFMVPGGYDITESRKAKLNLEKSEKRFRSIYENSTIGMYRTTPDGKIIMANPAIIKMLGYSSFDEISNLDLRNGGFADFSPRQEFIDQVESLGEVAGLESALIGKDGRILHIRETARAIRDSEGKTLYYDGFIEDISEHKRMAEREKRNVYNLEFLSQSSIALVNTPLDENIYEAIGQKLTKMLPENAIIEVGEYEPGINSFNLKSIIGTDSLPGYNSDGHNRAPAEMTVSWSPALLDILRSGKLQRVNNDTTGSTGFFSGMIHNANGDVIGSGIMYIMGFVREGTIFGSLAVTMQQEIPLPDIKILEAFGNQIAIILEKRFAESALSNSEEKYRSIVETTTDWIWEMDKTGKHTFSNSSIKTMLGYSTDEIIGQTSYPFIFPDDLPEVKKKLSRLIEEKSGWRGWIMRWRHKDGSYKILESNADPIFDSNGNLMGFRGSDRDITGRKKAEEELQHKSELQTFMMYIATSFIYLPLESTETAIQSSLEELSELLGADRSYVFDYNFGEMTMILRNLWTRKGLEINENEVQSLSLNELGGVNLDLHMKGEPIFISDTSTLAESSLKELFEKTGIKSTLTVPLMKSDECLGYVGISWVNPHHFITDDELFIVKVFSLLLANVRMRKTTQMELIKSEEKFRELVENMNDVFFTIDARSIITYVSPQVTALYNYGPSELIGKPFANIVFPEDRDKVMNGFLDIMNFNLEPKEFRYMTREGEICWAQTSSRPIIENETVVGIRGLFSDITKRKKDEEELRKLSMAVEQSPVSIVITDLKGEIEYINPVFTRKTGYTFEEAVGKNSRILKSGRTRKEDYRQLWSKISSGKEWTGEFYNKKKNGEFFWEAALISPIFNNRGEITHYLGVKEDITEKKEATRLLFDKVIETEERERMRYSNELHDGLGPIISTIKLYLQFLAENTDPEQNDSIMQRVNKCIDEAIQTVKEISHNLSPNVVNNFGLVAGIQNFINRVNETGVFSIVLNCNFDRRFERNIEIAFYRIITEMINNTFKYAGASRVEIRLNYAPRYSVLSLAYTDDGCGFNLDEVMSSRKGLGLSNMSQRINTLNGHIKFETSQGKGFKAFIDVDIPG
jgi:PAS domain S-box-containing protein